ncbi:hypothetical protein E1287_09125 [Actinomadura sp. KC06]|uniref:hypothetical protein n=1 Tax=Actinomadura sp. KC06 TaxID=2530369 RepID=UPI00104F7B08|nr:hypothetical protein [Actinomadura sp. KC06]TDD37306.1 hypothetical protein E1287_09125 [Actinomadura sp. KC06]
MSAGKHAVLPNERVVHLGALRDAVDARRELACGLIERRGVTWVSVVRVGGSGRLVEVGCDYVRAAWWFTWSDGRPIAPVRNVEGVVAVLVRELAGGR